MTSEPTNPTSETRVAIVTGATRGIGRSVAEALAQAGFALGLCSRSEAEARALADELKERFDVPAIGLACDVADTQACQQFVEAAATELGGLDVLINNAGVGAFADIRELSVEDWRWQIDTNLSGVFYCAKAALPYLLESDDAWIINVASLASRNAFAGGVGYNASKFGLLGMTEAMMLDLRQDGIRVSVVMPGSVNTHFHGRTPGEPSWKLEPEDVARAVVDLLRYPDRAHASRIELRPSRPPRK